MLDLDLKVGKYDIVKLLGKGATGTVYLAKDTFTGKEVALKTIEPDMTIGGSSFGPEMMILTMLHDLKVIQIPVNYLPRVGESSVTGDFRKAFFLGMTMIGLVLQYRLRSWLARRPRRVRAGGPA